MAQDDVGSLAWAVVLFSVFFAALVSAWWRSGAERRAGLGVIVIGLAGLYGFTLDRDSAVRVGALLDGIIVTPAAAQDWMRSFCHSQSVSELRIKTFSGLGDQEAERLMRTLNDLRAAPGTASRERHGAIILEALRGRGDLVDLLRVTLARAVVDDNSRKFWCDMKENRKPSRQLSADEKRTFDAVDALLHRGLQ
jgi:hypothetical protein